MADLKKGQVYKVIASSGLNLRKEPATSAPIILLMKEGAYARLVAEEVRESDGYHWYNVKYGDETGWAASEYLELVPLVEPEGPPIAADYQFTFGKNKYDMPAANLGKCEGTYIFTDTVGPNGNIIFTANSKTYWTTPQNIENMLTAKLIKVLYFGVP